MTEEIKQIDEEHIAVIRTNVSETLVSKSSLEAQKTALQLQIDTIDAQMLLFVPKE